MNVSCLSCWTQAGTARLQLCFYKPCLQEGVWVVGMILGSPAQTAGVEQGDQLLGIDEMQVDGQSPFQAASAISGGDAEPDTVFEPTVRLQVPTDAGSVCMHLVPAAA